MNRNYCISQFKFEIVYILNIMKNEKYEVIY